MSSQPKAKAKFMGVCADIANKMEVDVFNVRIITVILFMMAAPLIGTAYILLGLFASEEK